MKNKFTTVEITMMAVFAAILCVSAYLSIPTPLPNAAHITLLNFMIMLIALVFEVRDSTIIVALWMILGAVGVPGGSVCARSRRCHREQPQGCHCRSR